MRLKLSRRAVYVGTVVALVAMIGGFALAAFPNTFTNFGGASSNQNSGSFTAGNTIWAADGASVTLLQAAAPPDCGAVNTASDAATVYLDGSLACTAAASNQWYEDFAFAATEVSGDSDAFHWYVVGGVNANDQTFTVGYSASNYAGSVTLNVYIDMGPATANPITLGSISATVTGS